MASSPVALVNQRNSLFFSLPDYASTVTMELHRIISETSNYRTHYALRFLFNNQPIKLFLTPCCSECNNGNCCDEGVEFCPLDKFKEAMESRLSEDFYKKCHILSPQEEVTSFQRTEIPEEKRYSQSITGGLLYFLFALISVVILGLLLTRRGFIRSDKLPNLVTGLYTPIESIP